MKLCYVEENWAWFTDQAITGLGKQWGDDWDDAPYEHNAEPPYENHENKIIKVAWDGDFDTPCDGYTNSPYSVERINSGAIPWLVTSQWHCGETVVIPAGVSPEEFMALIKKGGGKVYTCS